MKRNDLEWSLEKEPTYSPTRRQRIPLHIDGAVKQHFAKRRQRIAAVHDVECSCHSCRAFDGTDWSEAYARSTGAVK